MTRAPAALRRLRRSLLAHRLGIAALCIGLTVAAGLQSQAAPAAPTVTVLVAARDLGGSTVIDLEDLSEGTVALLNRDGCEDSLVTLTGASSASAYRSWRVRAQPLLVRHL